MIDKSLSIVLREERTKYRESQREQKHRSIQTIKAERWPGDFETTETDRVIGPIKWVETKLSVTNCQSFSCSTDERTCFLSLQKYTALFACRKWL